MCDWRLHSAFVVRVDCRLRVLLGGGATPLPSPLHSLSLVSMHLGQVGMTVSVTRFWHTMACFLCKHLLTHVFFRGVPAALAGIMSEKKRSRSRFGGDQGQKPKKKQQARLTQIYAVFQGSADANAPIKDGQSAAQHAARGSLESPAGAASTNWWQAQSRDPVVAYARFAGAAKPAAVKLSGLSSVCPCELLLNFLPKQHANQLLMVLLQQSASWVRGTWWFAGLPQTAPRTSMHYQLDANVVHTDTSNPAAAAAAPSIVNSSTVTAGQLACAPAVAAAVHSASVIAALSQAHSPEQLSAAADLVASAVSQRMADPIHKGWQVQLQQLTSKAAERTGCDSSDEAAASSRNSSSGSTWHPTYALANLYKDAQESVGSHSDRLTALGPLPTVASLSLGATRTFRLHPADAAVGLAAAAEATAQAGHGASSSNTHAGSGDSPRLTSVDIELPHNSLLIMWPRTQEEWLHEVGGREPVGHALNLFLRWGWGMLLMWSRD